MKLIQLALIFLLATAFAACNNKPAAEAKAPETPIVGNDADEHGCRASAGYQWSAIKNECIRLFESGIRLDPKDASLDQTLSAFVVFASDADQAKAEVYLPGEKAPRLFQAQGGAGTWKHEQYTLTLQEGTYSLTGGNQKLLYDGVKGN